MFRLLDLVSLLNSANNIAFSHSTSFAYITVYAYVESNFFAVSYDMLVISNVY